MKTKECCKTHEMYNGWNNYETWAVNLWLTNEQSTSEHLTEIATMENLDVYEKTEKLKAWVESEMIPDLGATLASDLLNAAFEEVDWQEIIENHMENLN